MSRRAQVRFVSAMLLLSWAARAQGDIAPSSDEPLVPPRRELVRAKGRTLVEENDATGSRLVLERGKGRLEIQASTSIADPSNITAAIAPFLGRRDYLDVIVAYVSRTAAGGSRVEQHYVVHTGDTDTLACVVQGTSSRGNGDVTHTSSAELRALTRKPFAFEVVRTTSPRQYETRARRSTELYGFDAVGNCGEVPDRGRGTIRPRGSARDHGREQ